MCQEIDVGSQELKSIYHSGESRIAKDVDITIDVIEKMVNNISRENVNKTPEVREGFYEGMSCTM